MRGRAVRAGSRFESANPSLSIDRRDETRFDDKTKNPGRVSDRGSLLKEPVFDYQAQTLTTRMRGPKGVMMRRG